MSTAEPASKLRLWPETPWSEAVSPTLSTRSGEPRCGPTISTRSGEPHYGRSKLWLSSLPVVLQPACVALLGTLGWQPSVQFQPTLVGALWANVFLAGYYVGTLGRGRLWGAAMVLIAAYLATTAVNGLTDLGWEASLLLSTLLLVAGWGTTLLDAAACPPIDRQATAPRRNRWCRFSIAEIGFVTTLTACVAQALPRLSVSLWLMCGVMATLLAGVLCSWAACRWVWKDQWSLASLSAAAALSTLGLATIVVSAPTGLSLGHALQWLLSGPVNVVAAQSVLVIATLALWRWLGNWTCSSLNPADRS